MKVQRVQIKLTRNRSPRQVRPYKTSLEGVRLHWLRIENRVTFTLATLTYNIKSTGKPVYRRNLLSVYEQVCTLWSSSKRLLTVNVADIVLAMRGLRQSAVTVCNTVYLTIFVALLTLIYLKVASKLIYLTLHSPPSVGQAVSANSFHAI